ncbi:hypothetical protein ANO11243_034580 [Dothideomycetidae sp. 11243]|nr:hypothetical protein ANO11243_034580 [fungal sp. No.11243]
MPSFQGLSTANAFLPSLARPAANVTDAFLRLGLDTFAGLFFQTKVGNLQTPDLALAQASSEVQLYLNHLLRAGPLNWFQSKWRFNNAIDTVNDFVRPLVERTLPYQDAHAGPDKDEHSTFLYSLSRVTSDPKMIRDQIVSVLAAGRDPTSYTMSWMFYHLAMRPDLVQGLRKEILDRLGDRRPTMDDLKALRLVRRTIDETLRLYPPIPFTGKVAASNATLPRGGGQDGLSPIGVLKDTAISYSPMILQRRADCYPPASADFPDPLDFAPERWDRWTPEPGHYIPFSMGPRTCPGQEFSMTYMTYVTVRILQTHG